MSKTIPNVPDFITHEQYMAMFDAMGIDPQHAFEVRAAHDGVHALVFALDENGQRILDRTPSGDYVNEGYRKHRIFIPVRRDPDDRRTTRVRPVTEKG